MNSRQATSASENVLITKTQPWVPPAPGGGLETGQGATLIKKRIVGVAAPRAKVNRLLS